jgi:hypothetical protein
MKNDYSLLLSEEILAGNYYENFKFHKELAQTLGADNHRVIKMSHEVNKIQKDWLNLKQIIKNQENENRL